MDSRKPKTLMEAIKHYADADNALDEVADSRWAKGVTCQHCQAEKPMFLKTRRIWKCSKCRKQFSVKTKTVFEDSPITLDKWLAATWMLANCKNGISSYELARDLGVTQKSAWFMLHRIRLAMQDENNGGKLSGEVEIDETFIGGKARNMHANVKERNLLSQGRGTENKEIVLGMIERGGKVRTMHIPKRSKPVLQKQIRENVATDAAIFTDELKSYQGLSEFQHEVINHAVEYVRGNVHTNTMENFWSLVKRGLHGTYISVEPFHLFRYLDEQGFRYNNRVNSSGDDIGDFARFKLVLSHIVNRRITYKALIGKEGETSETF